MTNSNKKYTVTAIHFFNNTNEVQCSENGDTETVQEYSANVVINDSFIVQVAGKDNECFELTIPESHECYCNNEVAQNEACENVDIDNLIEQIEAAGFENNFGYLEDNADVTI